MKWMQQRVAALVPAIVLGVATMACSAESPMAADIPQPTTEGVGAARAVESGNKLARALALALGSAEARASLRDAMRDSRMTEHKLVLQDFAQTEAGRSLLRAAASGAGVSGDAFEAMLLDLPALDLYLPRREDRLNWRATPNLLVAAALTDDRGRVTAYTTGGMPLNLSVAELPAGFALLALHPAEPKAERIDAQALGSGEVVQLPTDGEISGVVEVVEDGIVTSTRSLAAPVAASSSRPGEASLVASDSMYMGALEVLGVCDNNNCAEGNEFEFRTYIPGQSTAFVLKLYGIPGDYWSPNVARGMYPRHPGLTGSLITNIVEMDGGLNSDDNFDPDPRVTSADNGKAWAVGDWRCGYTNQYGQHACGPVNWKEINYVTRW